MSPLFIFFGIIILFILSGIKVINEYERGVIFRLGRIIDPKGPGIRWVIPLVDKFHKISLRVITMDVPPQDVITRDNVSVKVNAVVYFRVIDPIKATIQVENYLYATSQLAQTTLRSILGMVELDELLSEREKLNVQLQEVLDKQTDPWGIKVTLVEVKYVDLPQEMQRAMAKQAEAERERRAKVISAEGEYQASTKLSEASDILSQNPMSLQLRYLQQMNEMASEKSSIIVFPLPIDLLRPFLEKGNSENKS
ncbi:MAG: slipin family protein [Candidatus Dadabacteria bacterium]|nr:slipin family protein [Candidatus Dadabacteria bacterium]NIX15851.1 slipin family protein [Candidatus Dadabacteria bacterium]NIY22570.1 slipin family protein [Candidatus Dadabacteria bacterium]